MFYESFAFTRFSVKQNKFCEPRGLFLCDFFDPFHLMKFFIGCGKYFFNFSALFVCVVPVEEKVVSESYTYPLGVFLALSKWQKFEKSVVCIFKKLEQGPNLDSSRIVKYCNYEKEFIVFYPFYDNPHLSTQTPWALYDPGCHPFVASDVIPRDVSHSTCPAGHRKSLQRNKTTKN